MLRLAPTIAYTLIVLVLLTGCSGTNKKQPPTSSIKLSDLVPANPVSPAKTAVFKFYTIELPAENIDRLSDIWSMLYTKPIQLTNPRASSANDFKFVFGEIQMWQRIAEMLESAGAALIEKNKLLLDYGQIKDFTITQINSETKVSYITSDLTIGSLTVKSGRLVLRLSVSPIPGERGVCSFNATPALIPDIPPDANEQPQKTEEKVFDALAFTVEMSPSDFFLMGPESYPGTNSLGNLVFTTAQGRKIWVYTVFCIGLSE
jgi:hypothetical protein